MKNTFLTALCVAYGFFVAPSSAAVGDKVTYPSFTSGHVYGETISKADLRGKVVFFEYWGINCGPCLQAMPHLVELQSKYGDDGFLVIASHWQGRDPRVKAYLEEQNVNFPVYEYLGLPESPMPGMLPHSVLIGADGRIIAQGKPWDLYDKVEAAVAEASEGYPILVDVELDKYEKLRKTIVSNGKDIESKIAPLREAAESGDAEAEAVCDAYDNWLEGEKEVISHLCLSNPMKAVRAVSALKKAVPSVTEYDEVVQKIREHPTYRKLAACQKKMKGLKKRMEKGARVSPSAFKSLHAELEEISGMPGEGVATLCSQLESELNAMEQSSSAGEKGGKPAREKKKKEKREKKGRD